MKLVIALSLFSSLILSAHPDHDKVDQKSFPQSSSKPGVLGHNGLTYTLDTKWAKVDPKTAPVRNGHALGESKEGQIYFLTDHLEAAFHVFEKDGTYVRSFGEGLTGGHGLEFFERDGEEFLIHVDCGWHANPEPGGGSIDADGKITILKKDGTVVTTFKNPRSFEKNPPKKKFKPCDVAVTPSGTILVVDGYASDYVYEFTQTGEFVRRWGGRKKGKVDHLHNAHGISIDTTNPDKPLVWVSSRNENKIKAFTLEGQYVESIHLPGAYAGQLFVRDGKMYTAVCWSKAKGDLGGKRQKRSGFVLVLDAQRRKVLSSIGGNEPIYKGGKLQQLWQEQKTFIHGHDLYVDKDGSIYVCEWASDNRMPVKLTPKDSLYFQ